ncbi:MAG TPA: HNH endonuclease signature motif containing protein [Pyrinomonadaceae bacterium]|nr:HNH endonuclease signature motif containing protein [Pyrinomonadaceae bacterium]
MIESKYVPAKLRKFVAERADFVCEYCLSQESFSAESFAVEHINPRKTGGKTVKENLAYSCLGCNSHKAAKTEAFDNVSETNVKLFDPRSQNWSEHFVWSSDFTEIFGLTAIGRATVTALKLNRKGVKNLRWALFSVGKHPPNRR